MTNKISLVVWDWYKTLSNNHLYERIEKDYPQAYETIQSYFLSNQDRMVDWKRGEMGYDNLHQEFSALTGIEKHIFDDAIRLLADDFDIEPKLLPYLDRFNAMGIEQIIVTDNYDKWDEFFLPEYSQYATKYFSSIVNSHKFRIAKANASSHLVENVASSRRLNPGQVLFIDDDKEISSILLKKGYKVICHHTTEDLLSQLDKYPLES